MTNSKPMSRLLAKRCKHKHVPRPLCGGRCEAAAFYPLKLIRTLLRGIRLQKDLSMQTARLKEGKICAVAEDEMVPMTSTCHKVDGGHIEIEYDPRNFRQQYRDEYTNEVLPHDLVCAAASEEHHQEIAFQSPAVIGAHSQRFGALLDHKAVARAKNHVPLVLGPRQWHWQWGGPPAPALARRPMAARVSRPLLAAKTPDRN